MTPLRFQIADFRLQIDFRLRQIAIQIVMSGYFFLRLVIPSCTTVPISPSTIQATGTHR
jgi:hypothetical protein